ncbi:MAG: VWA domain-containing protein [Bacteroidetes bacterium]|jgi:Ca-activated chloride channel homolog|nr:VWA domain-containing protein [Flavobacteriaceae bacterium]MDA0863482.1 VWA domain-containing protein [Bacteroidota bacterium]MDA1210457.1 VWA domain-containing protein [Bacteroidota bacterium]
MTRTFEFVSPEWFWLLALVPVMVFWFWYSRRRHNAEWNMSALNTADRSTNFWSLAKSFLWVLRLAAMVLIIIALARPRYVDQSTRIKTSKGIDIVMAIDVSASMLARDLTPNRLEALKEVAARFINSRPNDRLGLVEYAGESYTKTPLTSDKTLVLSALKSIEYNTIIEGGTAIGMGLATSVNRLKESRAKSKVIILLTDGVNNSGFIDPRTASELAVEFGIKVYTIGLGSNGLALSPVGMRPNGQFQYGKVPVEIDEALLQEIAQTTGGLYFRATNNSKLGEIYDEINKLEKTEVEEFKYQQYDEGYRPLILVALGLLLFEFLMRQTLFKSFI